jgi:hypothetical protein
MRFDEWQDSNGVPVASGAGGKFSAPGNIIQVVRAVDSTARSTTGTTYSDITGMSVTISPQRVDSEVLVLAYFQARLLRSTNGDNYGRIRITDSSNSLLSGAQEMQVGATISGQVDHSVSLVGRVLPNTTSAVTYKLQFHTFSGTTLTLPNNITSGQVYAIEVAA